MRWIVRIVMAAVLVVVAAVALLFLLPAEKIANLVTDQFENATGRAMTLQGDVRPSLWPELGVKTGAVTIANADWSDSGPMLQAEALSVGVDILALLSGAIKIKRVEAEAPQVLLEVSRSGRGNWDMAPDSVTQPTVEVGSVADGSAATIPAITLDKATINGGKITFIDHASGSKTVVNQIDAVVKLPDFAGLAEFDGSGAMNGQRFEISTAITGFADFLGNGAVPVETKLSIGGSVIDFDGRAGLSPMAAGGKADVDLADMTALFNLAGMANPGIPRGLGQTIKVNGDVTATDAGKITLRNGTLKLDHNVFSGAVDMSLAGRPRLVAQLASGALDFSALMAGAPAPGSGGSNGAAAASTGWSKDPYDISIMQIADAEISLSADSIDMGIAKLGRTRAVTNLDNGRAVTELKELVAYGGTMAGTWILNSRGGLSTRATLTGNGVALQPLLTELAGYDRLIANGDVAVNILGVGNDLNTLMNSLSGTGSASLGQGELRGLDLAGMLRTLDTSYVGEGAKTIFKSIDATFTLDKGVMRNDDLRMDAPLLTATGKGQLGLGSQTIEYRVVPALLPGQGGTGGVRVPLLITGPWANPRFKLDLEALAEQELADEIEEVKTKVETVVKEKLEAELGVKVDDLGDVEDALKKELEERAIDGVLKLFGGN